MRIPLRIPDPQKPFDLVGFGENSLDFLTVLAEPPAPDTKQRLQRFARMAGGQIATATAAAARLGCRVRYIGSFGDDDLGAMVRENLVREGVDVAASRIVHGATNRFAVILVDGLSGQRTVLWDAHPALTMSPGDVPRDAIESGRLLLLDCSDVAASIQAAKFARAAGVATMIDVETVRPGTTDLLQHIDVIVAAQAFPTALTGDEDLGRALQTIGREYRAAIVTVTLGPEGTLTWSNGREIRTPGFSIDCVDTTGAGDVFRGAFASACLRLHAADGDLETALQYANAAAALNCRALGAQGALPRPAEVERLLLSAPRQV
jgi:sugar/nucleoside kinase (ribokinase family)